MASETPVLRDDNGLPVRIGRTQEGKVGVNVKSGMTSILVVLSGERLKAFREAVDRAAMPGQPGAEVARHPVYACCQHCEHCGKEQCQQAPGRHCEHGADQPPHDVPCKVRDCEPGNQVVGEAVVPGQPLTVAAAGPAAMEALGELAGAAQEACPLCLADLNRDGSCSKSCAGVGDG